jgi:redox-sensitive bicupin YhaK (pirin superfamily)
VSHELAPGRGLWLHVIAGNARIGDLTLLPGDAASIEGPQTISIQAGPDGLEGLLFDLA